MEDHIQSLLKHLEGALWTPVRTRPRCEKKLAEFCVSRRIDMYLPLRKSLKRYQRRTFEFQVPMFPGYIFCQINEENSKTIVMSKAYLHRIRIDDYAEKNLIEELISIRALELMQKHDATLLVRPEIVSGAKVKVSKGPFAGLSGIVDKRKSSTTITINVELLGQSVTAQIDVEDIEAEKA